jgi:hypothetical protein
MESPSDANLMLVSGNQSGMSYIPSPELDYGTTYFWRVDTRQTDGEVLEQGSVWTFATGGAAINPSPYDGHQKIGYDTVLLSWDGGVIPASYDVYFGTDPNALGTPTNTTELQLLVDVDPNGLYYWAVDTKTAGGSVIVAGPVWSYSTGVLLAHWELDDGPGTTATDSSTNGYHATVDPDTPWTTGVNMGGIQYSTDYVATSAPAMAGGPVNQLSFSAWYKLSALSQVGDEPIYLGRTGNGDGGTGDWWIIQQEGHMGLMGLNDTPIDFYPYDNPSLNVWQHLVITMDVPSRVVRMYIDGELLGTQTRPVMLPKTLNPFSWGPRVNGPMDDIRLYNAVLTPPEVADLYAVGGIAKNPMPADEASLVAIDTVCWWDVGANADSQVFVFDDDPDLSADVLHNDAIANTVNSFDPQGATDLDLNQTYYWRVDTVQGSYTIEGNVWSFTTGADCEGPTLLSDTDGDCDVDIDDFAQLAAEWLDCTRVNWDCP